MRPIRILIPTFCLLLFSSCYSTKVQYDILKQSNAEKVSPDSIVISDDFKTSSQFDKDFFTVSEEEVDNKFNENLKQYFEVEKITNRNIVTGDTVHLRMICEYNGKYLNNYRIDGDDIEIGNNDYGTLIDNAITGIIIDEQKSVLATQEIKKNQIVYTDSSAPAFPNDDVNVQINCYITLDYIKGKEVMPEDIDYAVKRATQYKYSNEAEYRNKIEHDIRKEKKDKALYGVLDEMIDSNSVTYDIDLEPLIRTENNSLNSYYTKCAQSNSLTYSDFVVSLGYADLSTFYEEIDATSEKLTKEKILFYKIGKENGWELTDDEYSSYCKSKVVEMNYGSISQALQVFGSDILRWEIYKDKFSDKFFETYIDGYEIANAESDDSQDSDESRYEIINEKKQD